MTLLRALPATLLLAAACQANPVYFLVSTDQTGAQTQIDVNHSSVWVYSALEQLSFGGGKFVMKEGSNTSANIALSVWLGARDTGTLISALNFNNAQFDAAHEGNNEQSFQNTPFLFPSPVLLQAGKTYTIALTSAAPDVQSQAYFIKGTSVSFFDADNAPPPEGSIRFEGGGVNYVYTPPPTLEPDPVPLPDGGGVPSAVPEPSTWALSLAGALAFAIYRVRRTAPPFAAVKRP